MGTASAKTVVVLCLWSVLSLRASGNDVLQSSDAAIGQRVFEMLNAGFARDPNSMAQSHRLYESLRNDDGKNPRVNYAHGLVSLRQFKTKEALADFREATKQPGTAYRPAWQAMIWSHFIAKEYEAGFDAVLAYAKLIQDPDQMPPEFQHDETYWLGRIMSALELILDTPQARESWLQTDKKLTGLIGAVSLEAYHDGKEDVHVRHSLIEDEIRQSREKTKERRAAILEKKLDREGKLLDNAKDKRASLKKSATESKENFDEQSAAFKKQIERTEKDLAFLERRSATLLSLILTIEQQVSQTQSANRNQNSNAVNSNTQRVNALQNQLLVYQTEFQRTTALAQEVSLNAQRLSERQAEFQDQHQRTTGEILQKDAAIENWKERTQKRVAELKKAEANEKAPVVIDKSIGAKSLRAYVDLDLFAERDRVLRSFGVAPEGKK